MICLNTDVISTCNFKRFSHLAERIWTYPSLDIIYMEFVEQTWFTECFSTLGDSVRISEIAVTQWTHQMFVDVIQWNWDFVHGCCSSLEKMQTRRRENKVWNLGNSASFIFMLSTPVNHFISFLMKTICWILLIFSFISTSLRFFPFIFHHCSLHHSSCICRV